MEQLAPAFNRARRYSKTDVQYLNENELDALFAAGSARDLAIFEVAYHRGLALAKCGFCS